jgi:hypothetical protein
MWVLLLVQLHSTDAVQQLLLNLLQRLAAGDMRDTCKLCGTADIKLPCSAKISNAYLFARLEPAIIAATASSKCDSLELLASELSSGHVHACRV